MDTQEATNASTFKEIVNAYYQPLYRFGYSLSKNEHDAADLTQQAFSTYAEKGGAIRDAAKVKSWLFTTLYRYFLRRKRKGERIDHYEPELLENSSEAVDSSAGRSVDAKLALQALSKVDPVYREPLTLFYLQDLAYKEIAEALEIPIGTVMSRLSRGKAQLRERFQQNENEPAE